MKKSILLFFTIAFAVLSANATPRKVSAMKSAARVAINEMRAEKNIPVAFDEPAELHRTGGLTIYGYEDGGFAIISNDDLMPEVLAISNSHFSKNENPGLQWWLKAMSQVCDSVVARGAVPRTATTKPTALGFPDHVDPIVPARWDQDAPYWNKCPLKGSSRCLTGCVATAIAQVLYAHRTTIVGSGQRSINEGASASFNFEGWSPKYDLMLDSYSGSYTNEQADAVADLMLACGVAVNMDYDPSGSGAYTDQAAEGLRTYFNLENAYYVDRDEYSERDWMTMVYKNLSEGHAFYYSGVDYSGWQPAGHAFVCDGYDANGRVNINWGWSGSDNGYYDISLLNPPGYKFSSYQDMILNMWNENEGPDTDSLYNDTIMVAEAGTLRTFVPDTLLACLKGVKLSGSLNADDIAFLRDLAAGDSLVAKYGVEKVGHLASIDLTDVVLADSALAKDAFRDAKVLRTIILPRVLKAIGGNAFNGCSKLNMIKSRTYAVPTMGTGCFTGVPSSVNIYVIAGSTESYKRNGQWKSIMASGVVTEYGTSFVARNNNRVYGTSNPVLGYVQNGTRVVGAPKLTCEATPASPVGSYVINIAPGTVAEGEDIYFVNGTLNIQKALLTVGVQDTVRYEDEPTPEFTLTYEGFRNEDCADSLTVLPVATCDATELSAPGEYEIKVSGGESKNYKFEYTTGKLTILPGSVSIAKAKAAAKNGTFDVYSLSGTLLRSAATSLSDLPAGTYIVNGEKVVRK